MNPSPLYRASAGKIASVPFASLVIDPDLKGPLQPRFASRGLAFGAVLCLDADSAQLCSQPEGNPAPLAQPESLVYVYTSGSTGVPKGCRSSTAIWSTRRVFWGNACNWTTIPRTCTGGEALTARLLDRLAQLNATCEIINHYGPTETAVGSLTLRLREQTAPWDTAVIPIGRPIANTRVYILDDKLQPVPVGVVENCTSGERV